MSWLNHRRDKRQPVLFGREASVELRLVGSLQYSAKFRAWLHAKGYEVAAHYQWLRRGSGYLQLPGSHRKPLDGLRLARERRSPRVVRRGDGHGIGTNHKSVAFRGETRVA